MDMNIINIYLESSTEHIISMNKLLLGYLYVNNDLLNDSIHKKMKQVVKDYLKNTVITNNKPKVVNIDMQLFLDSNQIKQEELKGIMSMLVNYTVGLNKISTNESLIKLYKILSNSILISIELYNKSNSIVGEVCSFKEAMNEIQNEYSNDLEKEVSSRLTGKFPLLKNHFDTCKRYNKKIAELYTNLKVDYELKEILCKNSKEKWFQIIPQYHFEQLKLDGKRKIQTIIEEQKIYTDIVFILLDQLSYTILKDVLLKKKIPKYIISLPANFIKTKTNVKRLIKLLDQEELKKVLYFELEYKEMNKYLENFNMLKQKNISFIISSPKDKYDKNTIWEIKFIALDEQEMKDDKLLNLLKYNKPKILLDLETSDFQDDMVYLIRNANSKTRSKENLLNEE